MPSILRRAGAAGLFGLSLSLTVARDCRAQEGAYLPNPAAGVAAPRPEAKATNSLRGRVFVPKGYAGASYPRLGQGPVLNPTGYWVPPDGRCPRPARRRWGR